MIRRRRGISIDMGGGDRLCPICGETYRVGRYRDHLLGSAQHFAIIEDRRKRRSHG